MTAGRGDRARGRRSRDAFVAGYLENLPTVQDVVVLALAGATGAVRWQRDIDGTQAPETGPGGEGDYGWAIRLGAGGDVVVAGSLGNEGTSADLAILSLGASDGAVGPLRGARLNVRDAAGDPAARRLTTLIQDSAVAVPAATTVGDPTLTGATLRLLNPATLETATFSLPAGLWTALGTPPGARGYRYRDPTGSAGPCKAIQVRPGRLRAVCLGALAPIPFTLDEPTQTALTVSIELGGGEPQCATFGGTVRRDAGTANPGPAGAFIAKGGASVLGRLPVAAAARPRCFRRRVLRPRGRVWAGRYHAHILRTPREVRNAFVYVLQNFRKHLRNAAGTDPRSSARWFQGWRTIVAAPLTVAPVVEARTWLARVGWRRHGRLDVSEAPRETRTPRATPRRGR